MEPSLGTHSVANTVALHVAVPGVHVCLPGKASNPVIEDTGKIPLDLSGREILYSPTLPVTIGNQLVSTIDYHCCLGFATYYNGIWKGRVGYPSHLLVD